MFCGCSVASDLCFVFLCLLKVTITRKSQPLTQKSSKSLTLWRRSQVSVNLCSSPVVLITSRCWLKSHHLHPQTSSTSSRGQKACLTCQSFPTFTPSKAEHFTGERIICSLVTPSFRSSTWQTSCRAAESSVAFAQSSVVWLWLFV